MFWSKVKWAKLGRYSGPRISGVTPYTIPNSPTLLEAAVWLTAQIESGGKFGSVMAYDGSGMTAGLHQAIAVYPREIRESDGNALDDQGELWALLQDIKRTAAFTLDDLEVEFLDIGWKMDRSHLYFADGKPVPGRVIRDEFTPPDGVVPRWGESWDSARGWALIFHDIFSNPATFGTQVEFGKAALLKALRKRIPGCTETLSQIAYKTTDVGLVALDRGSPIDLAIAVFLSFHVNAPSRAMKELSFAWNLTGHQIERLPKTLMRRLATTSFANWQARYQRTRKEAMRLWDRSLFSGPAATMILFS
jgi:hypothetical protein